MQDSATPCGYGCFRTLGTMQIVCAVVVASLSIYVLADPNGYWPPKQNVVTGTPGLIVSFFAGLVGLASFQLHIPSATIQMFGYFWLIVTSGFGLFAEAVLISNFWTPLFLEAKDGSSGDQTAMIIFIVFSWIMVANFFVQLVTICLCYSDLQSAKAASSADVARG